MQRASFARRRHERIGCHVLLLSGVDDLHVFRTCVRPGEADPPLLVPLAEAVPADAGEPGQPVLIMAGLFPGRKDLREVLGFSKRLGELSSGLRRRVA